jgi:hypothetical protein
LKKLYHVHENRQEMYAAIDVIFLKFVFPEFSHQEIFLFDYSLFNDTTSQNVHQRVIG